VRFRVLGPLEVRDRHGEPVRLGSPKLRAVLALLLVSANRPLSASRLVDAVWPDRPPPTAVGALRTYVSTLRRELQLGGVQPPRLVTDAAGYRMDVTEADLDLLAFEELATSGERALRDGDPLAATEQLRRGLTLWRGRPLEDVAVDADPDGRLVVAEERRLAASETLVEARLALGQHAELAAELCALVEENPLREQLWQHWMLALYRAGRQAEALAAYRRLRDRLAGELGTEPARAVRDLHERMLAADPVLDLPGRLSPGTRTVVPRQLPADVATFTGRAAELTELAAVLRRDPDGMPPIGAIDGVAGIGKSALAVHAAHLVAECFPDGQLYADMADGTRLGVLGWFLRSLDVPDAGRYNVVEAASRFRAETATRRLLVVLDNVTDEAQVRPLLPAGPGCAVLVTSRRVLSALDGVRHVHLRPLSSGESMTLLGRLAGSERVAADPGAARRLVALCGGLPLAVRIAGARLAARPAWPVRTLTGRLADTRRRLDELRAGDLDVRASLLVGHRLLAAGSEAERTAAAAFGLLGLPATTDLSTPFAERLLGATDPVPVLEMLVDAQLLESRSPDRYRLHDLLRLLARELAAESWSPGDLAAALTRAMRWQVATAWSAYATLRPGDPRIDTAGDWARGGTPLTSIRTALDWLETERANLLASAEQAAATDGLPDEIPGHLARALFAFFHIRGHRTDWIRLNRTALAVALRTGDRYAEAFAHRDLGAAYELRGDWSKATTHLRAGLELFTDAGDDVGRASCLNGLGTVYDSLGGYDRAADCLLQALSIARRLGNPHSVGVYLNNLGPVYGRLGRYDDALNCLAESGRIWRDLGNRRGEAAAVTNLGEVHEAAGSLTEALARYTDGLAVFRELADEAGQAHCLTHLGLVHRGLGRPDQALQCLRAALASCERTDDRRGTAQCLRLLGEILQETGNGQRRANE
jgi:DNA-binding SARP family transcriptional activator